MIGLLGAKIWKENGVDFGNPVNLVPLAAGIIIAIGDVDAGDHRRLRACPASPSARSWSSSSTTWPGRSRRHTCGRRSGHDDRRGRAGHVRGRRRRRPRETRRARTGVTPESGGGFTAVKPAPFAYHRAASLDEAVELLAATGGKVLAGGQSLVPLHVDAARAARARWSTSTTSPGLDRIEVDERRRPDRCARAAPLRSSCDDGGVRREPAAAPGAAPRRAPDDPQPRHDGGQPRACRPGRRDAGRARLLGGRGRGDQRATGHVARSRPATSSSARWSRRSSRTRSPSRRPSPTARRQPAPRGSSSRAGTATTPWSASVRSCTLDRRIGRRRARRLALISVGPPRSSST